MALIYLFLAVLLVLLNGFFVLAEFAAVKMRPSRVRELLNDGVRGAVAAKNKGLLEMYFVEGFKSEYALDGNVMLANEAFFRKLRRD